MMATLFGICSESCNCSEETCSLKGEQFFQITEREETPCAETTTCSVCDVFSRHPGLCALMARAHSSKNARMTQLLASSTALHQIYTLGVPCQLSPAERVQRKTKVKDLLCKIFDCKRNRLQCMKHIGQLAQLLPKLLCVQLVTGHSLLGWFEESGTCSEFPAKSTVKISCNSCQSEKTSSSVPLESIPHLREDCRWGGYYPNIWLLICKPRIFFLLH